MAKTMRVVVAHSALLSEPKHRAIWHTEVLYGEQVEVIGELAKGYFFVRTLRDEYQGYVAHHALAFDENLPVPTHHVRTLTTIVRAKPSPKLPSALTLDLNALVTVKGQVGPFALVADPGYVIADDLAPIGVNEPDWVAVAEKFLGAPYLWGGRTTRGVDCSGLIQTAMNAAGFKCPRDSADIERQVGSQTQRFQEDHARGDLVFWPGHVGVMVDGQNLLHATVDTMRVVVEPRMDVVLRRRANGGGECISIRRP